MTTSYISKTVRMPSDLVDFIESCPFGDNFSQKLLGILYDYRDGDDVRQMEKDQYIEAFRVLLREYNEMKDFADRLRSSVDLLHEMICCMIPERVSLPDPLAKPRADPGE